MRATITSVDNCPAELDGQVPLTVGLIRPLPGRDRPDYWLGRLARPIRHTSDGVSREIRYPVLAARLVGTAIQPSDEELTVAIAYVLDESQVDLPTLDMSKCLYAAIGEARIVATTNFAE